MIKTPIFAKLISYIAKLEDMSNFKFLKEIDKDLFNIIDEAEKLYRDEYFEQAIVQIRRFAENACRNMLKSSTVAEGSFDDMVSYLSDRSKGKVVEKEFIDDLYFIKKAGNKTVHGTKIENAGEEALECLQRAFEVAINYAIYNGIDAQKVQSIHYDIELLITGKKSKKSLAEKYLEKKEEISTPQKEKPSKTKTKSKSTKTKVETIKTNQTNNTIGYVKIIFISLCILTIIMISCFIFL